MLVPLFTAFYNIGAAVGIYPTLVEQEKRLPHHLRYDAKQPIAGSSSTTTLSVQVPQLTTTKSASDLATERRRAKALKVIYSTYFFEIVILIEGALCLASRCENG